MGLRSSILHELQTRGFVHQCTNLEALDAHAAKPPLTAYVGFDCTAPSLHIGNLISIMMLRWWQEMGHRPIVLLGGATTRIGDPSGKEETRKLLDEGRIEENIQCIKDCFQRFLRFDESPTGALLVNNREWLDDLNYIDFLRDYGRHFSVNRMLGFDSVKTRLEREQNLSFLEFNYMVFQAYDFLELSRRHDCVLQMGGADQWGNIVNGIELARRVDGRELFGLTSPLITTANGQKMGKTASGAVWLDKGMTNFPDYWQYWRNVDDEDIGRFLRLFTELTLENIAQMEKFQGSEMNNAKETLADETTLLLHGGKALKEVYTKLGKSYSSKNVQRIVRESPSEDSTPKSTPEAIIQNASQTIQKQTALLQEFQNQVNYLKKIQKQATLLQESPKRTTFLRNLLKQTTLSQKRKTFLKKLWEKIRRQVDPLKKIQEQEILLERIQGQIRAMSDLQRKINFPSISHALQKQTNFLSALQKEKNLLNALQEGIGLLDALREVGLASSNSEARNFVRDGAVRINGKIIKDEKYILTLKDVREADGKIQLSIGKWRHRLLPET